MRHLLFFLLLSISAKSINSIDLNRKLMIEINKYRLENNLDTLMYDSICDSAAYYHSQYLAKAGFITHEQELDVDGYTELDSLNDRFSKAGLTKYSVLGENICKLTDSTEIDLDSIVKFTIDGWKNSKSHNEMLLDPEIKMAAVNFSTANFVAYFEVLDDDFVYITRDIPYVYWIVFDARG